jgi:hypothetical protein
MTDLDELEKLLKQATPGPWELGEEGGGFWRRGYRPINAPDHHAVFEAVVRMEGENANDPQLEANAQLIAALRNCAEELVRDERRLARLERMFRVMSPNIDGNHAWTFTGSPTLRGPNLRAAIDAAIAQEQP